MSAPAAKSPDILAYAEFMWDMARACRDETLGHSYITTVDEAVAVFNALTDKTRVRNGGTLPDDQGAPIQLWKLEGHGLVMHVVALDISVLFGGFARAMIPRSSAIERRAVKHVFVELDGGSGFIQVGDAETCVNKRVRNGGWRHAIPT